MPNTVFPAGTFSESPQPVIRDGSLKTSPEVVLSGLSGFSALTPVLFEVGADLDRDTLPRDGGVSLQVFDRVTGARVPVITRVSLVADTLDVRFLRTPASTILQAFPQGKWEFSHRYVAVATNALKDRRGAPMTASAGVRAAIANPATGHADTLAFLQTRGIAPQTIVSFTEFTVRDEASATQPTLDTLARLSATEFGLRITDVNYFQNRSYAAIVKGMIELPDFTEEDGSVRFTPDATFRSQWIPFRLMLPRVDAGKRVPLALLAHGQGMLKEVPMITVAPALMKQGVAAFFIDMPLHGQRLVLDEDGRATDPSGLSDYFLLDFRNPRTSLQVAGSAHQILVEYYTALQTLRRVLPTLDVLPRAAGTPGDGIADIDTERVYFQAASLGTVFGTAFSALAPGLRGACLEMGGGGITSTLNNSGLLRLFHFHRIIPKALSSGDGALFLNVGLHIVDECDGLNFARRFRETVPPLAPRALALHYNLGDTVMPIESTLALASIARLPHVQFPGLESRPSQIHPLLNQTGGSVPDFEQGYGLIHNQKKAFFLDWSAEWSLQNLIYHGSKPDGSYQTRWLQQVLAP
jgi:hypothetical protein